MPHSADEMCNCMPCEATGVREAEALAVFVFFLIKLGLGLIVDELWAFKVT